MNPLALIPAPYRLLAMAGLLLLAMGGSYLKGRSDGRAVVNAQALRAMKKGLDAIEWQRGRIADAESRASVAEMTRQTEVRSIYVETQKLVDRPVSRIQCLDADSVRLIDRATAAANGQPTPASTDQPGGASHATP